MTAAHITAPYGHAEPGPEPAPPTTPAQHYLANINGCASQDWQDGFNACAAIAAAPEFGGVAVAEVVHGEGGPGGVRLKLRAGVAWHQFPHGTQIFTHPPTDVASA